MMIRSFRKQQQHLLAAPSTSGEKKVTEEKRASGGSSLYSWLPAPDPEKEKSAEARAKESDIFADPVPEDPSLVVFLDIDGVLRRLEKSPVFAFNGEMLPLDLQNRALAPEAMRALRYIVHRTGAGIVLSSEWRRSSTLHEEAQTALRALGMPTFRGTTPLLRDREDVLVGNKLAPDKQATGRLRWAERRAREISEWLCENTEVKNWVALDDLDLSLADDASVRNSETFRTANRLVLTDPEVALTQSNARQACEMLLKGKRSPPRAASERRKKVSRTS